MKLKLLITFWALVIVLIGGIVIRYYYPELLPSFFFKNQQDIELQWWDENDTSVSIRSENEQNIDQGEYETQEEIEVNKQEK